MRADSGELTDENSTTEVNSLGLFALRSPHSGFRSPNPQTIVLG
jgi:hypothetical protein